MVSAVPAHVAVVDDEESLLEAVSFALRKTGYRVSTHGDGAVAWSAFERELPDLVVLDVVMPRLDGLELCRRLRAFSETLPILFLTSRDDELDRVLGLELGADDYLCKPFSMRELLARVKVLLRRLEWLEKARSHESSESEAMVAGRLLLDLDRHLASWDGEALRLTVTEFRLLCALARRPGHVKTREQLLHEAYPQDTFVEERSIDSHVKRLRAKLTVCEGGGRAIETVYGVGYRLRVLDE